MVRLTDEELDEMWRAAEPDAPMRCGECYIHGRDIGRLIDEVREWRAIVGKMGRDEGALDYPWKPSAYHLEELAVVLRSIPDTTTQAGF